MKKIFTPIISLLLITTMSLTDAKAQSATNYGIYVGETRVTSDNKDNILNDSKASFSYNPSTKTLTVKDATLNNQGSLGTGISNREVDGLTILFIGDNVFNTRNEPLDSKKPLTIKGPGSLKGTSSESAGINFGSECTTCVIGDGINLDITGYKYGLRDYANKTALKVKHEDTRISLKSGSGYYTVYNLKSLTLQDGLYISEPENGYFSESQKTILDKNNNPYQKEVIITCARKYDLWINGVQVTSGNASNIQEGVSYSDGTLYLDNATIDNSKSERYPIRSKGSLHIKLKGENKIISKDFAGISASKATDSDNSILLIDGEKDASLNITCEPVYMFEGITGIYLSDADLVFDNGISVTVEADNRVEGEKGTEEITVTNSATRVYLSVPHLSGGVALKNIGKLTLGEGLYIYKPAGGYFSTALRSITTDGKEAYGDDVFINNTVPAAIGEIEADKHAAGSYDLNGRRIKAPQKGITIHRMDDGSVKKVLK